MQLWLSLHRRESEAKFFDPTHPGSYWSRVHASEQEARDCGPLNVGVVPIEVTHE